MKSDLNLNPVKDEKKVFHNDSKIVRDEDDIISSEINSV